MTVHLGYSTIATIVKKVKTNIEAIVVLRLLLGFEETTGV